MKKFLPVLICASLMFIACGKKKKSKSVEQVSATTAVAVAGDGVKLIKLTAGDDMSYNLREIKVKVGEEVTLELKHTGSASKQVMGHNFVLLAKGVNLEAFAQKAMTAAATDYIPDESREVLAHTKLLGGGETDTIKFKAPEAGTYEFLCSFPGHFSLMRGKFIVE